jgi:hypothetical protein
MQDSSSLRKFSVSLPAAKDIPLMPITTASLPASISDPAIIIDYLQASENDCFLTIEVMKRFLIDQR